MLLKYLSRQVFCPILGVGDTILVSLLPDLRYTGQLLILTFHGFRRAGMKGASYNTMTDYLTVVDTFYKIHISHSYIGGGRITFVSSKRFSALRFSILRFLQKRAIEKAAKINVAVPVSYHQETIHL